ncbi:MAG TPA: acetyl-CoA carboxylase biotin carboxyl carrier protein subunit [Gemmatimonadales bacterium]
MKYLVVVYGREIEVEIDGTTATVGGQIHRAELHALAGTPMHQLVIDDAATSLGVEAGGEAQWLLTHRGDRAEVDVLDERARRIRGIAAASPAARGPAALRAPMPGLVVRVQVEPGQAVGAGAGLVVLEAMKMENELRSVAAGVVRSVRVKPGEPVEKGQVLVELEAGT